MEKVSPYAIEEYEKWQSTVAQLDAARERDLGYNKHQSRFHRVLNRTHANEPTLSFVPHSQSVISLENQVRNDEFGFEVAVRIHPGQYKLARTNPGGFYPVDVHVRQDWLWFDVEVPLDGTNVPVTFKEMSALEIVHDTDIQSPEIEIKLEEGSTYKVSPDPMLHVPEGYKLAVAQHDFWNMYPRGGKWIFDEDQNRWIHPFGYERPKYYFIDLTGVNRLTGVKNPQSTK